MDAQRGGCCWRRLSAPKVLDQSIIRDQLVRADEQQGEQHPLPLPSERHDGGTVAYLKRAEYAELHALPQAGE